MDNNTTVPTSATATKVVSVNPDDLWRLFMERCQEDSFQGELRILHRVCYPVEKLKELFDSAFEEWTNGEEPRPPQAGKERR